MVAMVVVVVRVVRGSRARRRGRRELAGFQSLLAVEIVDLALGGVAEDVVCLGDLLELGLGLGSLTGRVFVRVPNHRQSLVRLLQVVFASVAMHFQYIVIIDPHFSSSSPIFVSVVTVFLILMRGYDFRKEPLTWVPQYY